MEDEFTAPVELDPAGLLDGPRHRQGVRRGPAGRRGVEVLTRTLDGALLAVFIDKWRLRAIEREHPGVTLTPMLAAGVPD